MKKLDIIYIILAIIAPQLVSVLKYLTQDEF